MLSQELKDLTAMDLGVGIGLRSPHYAEVCRDQPEHDWFEVISENFMHTGGRPLRILDQVAERYPLVMHGVSMNIGSVDPLDLAYLAELKQLRERCGARFISDHLCWTGVQGQHLHDLLPLPYTEEALLHLIPRIRQVQDYLEAPLVLENPSTYLEFHASQMSEEDFLVELCAATGCGLLLDLNNVFVCSENHGLDPVAYLKRIPWDHVVQFHLAGHTRQEHHLIDTHSGPACAEVWDLYRMALGCSGGRSTLFEWDEDIPALAEVAAQADMARAIRAEVLQPKQVPS